jgi:hypothetical protein
MPRPKGPGHFCVRRLLALVQSAKVYCDVKSTLKM